MTDRYYTPQWAAEKMVNAIRCKKPSSVIDSSCGRGSLLEAAHNAFPGADLYGLDIDRAAIHSLKEKYPEWTLSVGDFLNARSRNRTNAVRNATGCDVVLLNPPFSMGSSSIGEIASLGSESVRCSLSMAHLLTSLQVIAPQKCVVGLVPESMLFSDLDEAARSLIRKNCNLQPLESLGRDTFDGAYANSLIIRISAAREENYSKQASPTVKHNVRTRSGCTLVRGGLPVHKKATESTGFRYVHSTDIRKFHNGGIPELDEVKPIQRGRVEGLMILLPRVGMPKGKHISPVFLNSEIQLSDCVIALCFENRDTADYCARLMRQPRGGITTIYKGTGARYTTNKRIVRWLKSNQVEVEVKSRLHL